MPTPCPQCQATQCYTQKETKQSPARVYCPACSFSCFLKHYKSYFVSNKLNNNNMENKMYQVIISEVNTYSVKVEALSPEELKEAFERGDVNYTGGRLIDSNSEIAEINLISNN